VKKLGVHHWATLVVIRKRHRANRETFSIVKAQLMISYLPVFWLAHYTSVSVWRDNCTKHCVNININFAEATILTRFTTTVIKNREIPRLFFSKLRQIIYFQNTGFGHCLSKYRPFTGLYWISSKISARPVKCRPSGNPSWTFCKIR